MRVQVKTVSDEADEETEWYLEAKAVPEVDLRMSDFVRVSLAVRLNGQTFPPIRVE
jgi:hypothetical protein